MPAGAMANSLLSKQSDTQNIPEGELCIKHKRKIEIICIDCKERICSNCALFDDHRLHQIKMEQEVLDEISTRSECLMEMFTMI